MKDLCYLYIVLNIDFLHLPQLIRKYILRTLASQCILKDEFILIWAQLRGSDGSNQNQSYIAMKENTVYYYVTNYCQLRDLYCLTMTSLGQVRNRISGLGWGVGGVIFSLQYFSLQILRLYTDFELHVYPGIGRKVFGGGGWWWVECEFSVLLWSKPFPSGLSLDLAKPNNTV